MSTRTTIRPQVVIPSAQQATPNSQSMAGNLTSAPTILSTLTKLSYSVAWTGTSPVGTFSVQVSNDYTLQATGGVTGGTWNTLPLNLNGTSVTAIPISGNSGNGFIDIETLSAGAVQLVYTAGSGTGTLTASVKAEVA